MGGTLIAFVGGLFHWWPKMTGKMFNELGGRISAALVFIGFNMTFLPQFVLGSRGMPRRYATYDEEFAFLHQLSSYGSFLLGIGLLIAGLVLLYSLFKGAKAPANPWGGVTLEWQCPSPPPYYNFARPPIVGDPYNFTGLSWDAERNNYYFVEPITHPDEAPEVPEEAPAHAGGQQ